MNLLEKSSKRKVKALKAMVESQEYSPAFTLEKLENYYDKGRIIPSDYESLAEYLEELLNKEEIHKEVTDNEATSDDVVPYEMVNEEHKTLEPLF